MAALEHEAAIDRRFWIRAAPVSAHLKYRADINGLRAIAVLSVLFDHLGLPWFGGGYFGVDVFFVISGFLISGIILTEVKAGDFSLARFYERRVRRIFPALAATLLGSLVLAWIYYLPFEMKSFCKSLLAAVFCVSNLFFWGKDGYFQALSMPKPLLHTWSLAVEEQFYFAFPLFLMLAYHLVRKKIDYLVITLFVFSLAVGLLGAYYRGAAAFYLAPARARELLLGALLSLQVFPELRSRFNRNLASLLGLAMIGFSLVYFSADTLYPGIASIVPCLGAALIIEAGRSGDSFVGSLLATRPMVFIGLISYSLYLWHWPIIVFHRVGFLPTDGYPAYLDNAFLIGLSILVATLSWRFVETPFRNKQVSAPTLYRFALAGAAALVISASALWATNGLPWRFQPQVARAASYLEYDPRPVSRAGTCFFEAEYSHADIDPEVCLHFDPTRKNYLLIGDSHAAHLWYGLAKEFPELNVMQATAAGCKPTIDPAYHEDKRHCRRLMDYVAHEYLPTHQVDALLIEAVWREEDLALLPHTLEYAKRYAKNVVLFGPMVQYDASLPRVLAVSLMKNDPQYPFQHRLPFLDELDSQMAALAQRAGVRYVSFNKMLCGPDRCETSAADGAPLMYDYGHLTVEGSTLVASFMRNHGELP
ncbi:MAG: acyltransferase [Proteobacteria bacterium]|nr:acyltransferase [Pseudomonadota bacterium]